MSESTCTAAADAPAKPPEVAFDKDLEKISVTGREYMAIEAISSTVAS